MGSGEWARRWPRGELAAVAALSIIAIVLRLSQVGLYSAYWPDETHQYLEQAFRLLTGHGLVPWEYVDGLRSRLLPLILAGPMAAGRALGGAEGGLIASRALIFLFALAMLPAAWKIGRLTSPAHAIAALGAVGLWFEIVTWSAHVLTETISITSFVVAAALLMGKSGRQATFWAGVLLAFGAIMRIQHAPAFAIFALAMLQLDIRRWGFLLLGALPVLAISSAVDVAFGQWPFEWVWQNYVHTIAGTRGTFFGESPSFWYLGEFWTHWLLALPVILWGAIAAPAVYRPLILTALANLIVHMLIGHKEYRYIALSLSLFVMLGAMGWVSRLELAKSKAIRDRAAAIVVVGTAILSLSLAIRGPEDLDLVRRSTMGKLQNVAGRDPQLCGLGAVGPDVWSITRHPMDRQVDIYISKQPERLLTAPAMGAFNQLIAPPDLSPSRYAKGQCNGLGEYRYCLFKRPGGCAPSAAAAPFEVQRYRRDLGF
jgi:phosphatidylinositol glycan class B